jgi:hypothetical protein
MILLRERNMMSEGQHDIKCGFLRPDPTSK